MNKFRIAAKNNVGAVALEVVMKPSTRRGVKPDWAIQKIKALELHERLTRAIAESGFFLGEINTTGL